MWHRGLSLGASAVVVATLAAACSDLTEVSPEGPAFSYDQTAAGATVIASAAAQALADSSLRTMVLEDMRDSPFRERALHLTSYLQGSRGSKLLESMSAKAGIAPAQLLRVLSGIGPLEISMPIGLQRRQWRGDGNIVVVAQVDLRTPANVPTSFTGFDPVGRARHVAVDPPHLATLFLITPPRRPFGPDPEATRAAAPRRQGETVSVFGECGEEPVEWCEEEWVSTPPPSGGISLGFDWNYCTSTGIDADYDGFSDQCEYDIAHAFRPALVFHQYELYSSRESYWAGWPQPISGNEIKIFYLLALHFDGPPVAHNGDSEFAELTISYSNGMWRLNRALLSAHWMSMWFPDGGDWTRDYSASEMQYPGAYRGRPYVYVSKDHHALYNSKQRCDSRVGDSCSTALSSPPSDFFVGTNRNIGNGWYDPMFGYFARLIDCTGSTAGYPGVECFWSGNQFAGWHTSGGTTPYKDPLQYYGWM